MEQGSGNHIGKGRNKGCCGKGGKRIVAENQSVPDPVDNGRREHSKQNGCLNLAQAEENDDEQSDEHGYNGQNELIVFGTHGIPQNARSHSPEEVPQSIERCGISVAFRVNARIGAETDVHEHKTDCRTDAEPYSEGNCFHNFLTDVESRQQQKDDTFRENDT